MKDSNAVRSTLAERLRQAREQAGLSQAQVATKLRIHRPSVSEIEAGRRRVSAEELSQLADIYGVSLSWLMQTTTELADPAVELAARELAKLKKGDLDRVLDLLRTLRRFPSR
jgi:transcriptional regulator with XRE-family HTH domain